MTEEGRIESSSERGKACAKAVKQHHPVGELEGVSAVETLGVGARRPGRSQTMRCLWDGTEGCSETGWGKGTASTEEFSTGQVHCEIGVLKRSLEAV